MNRKKSQLTAFGIVCLMLSFACVCLGEEIVYQRQALAEKIKNDGMGLEKSGNYKEALKKYNKSIHYNSSDANTYVVRARLYEKLSMPADALDDLRKALEMNPRSAFILNERGVMLIKHQRLEAAKLDFKRAIEIETEFVTAYVNLANTELVLKREDVAFEYLAKAIRLKPQSFEPYFARANIYFQTKRFDEAILDYRRVLELNPKILEAHFNRGVSLYKKERYAEALPHFEQAVQLTKKWALFYCWRGLTYYALENYNQAWIDYAAAIKNGNETEGLCYESFVGHNPQKKSSDFSDVHSQIVELLKKQK